MVGLLHAMAFMVLLLIGWVIWNNKPLPQFLGWLHHCRALVKISRRDRDFIKNSDTKTSKFVHFTEIFQKNVVITSEHARPKGGKRAFPQLEIETKHQDSIENMKLVAQFQSID